MDTDIEIELEDAELRSIDVLAGVGGRDAFIRAAVNEALRRVEADRRRAEQPPDLWLAEPPAATP